MSAGVCRSDGTTGIQAYGATGPDQSWELGWQTQNAGIWILTSRGELAGVATVLFFYLFGPALYRPFPFSSSIM